MYFGALNPLWQYTYKSVNRFSYQLYRVQTTNSNSYQVENLIRRQAVKPTSKKKKSKFERERRDVVAFKSTTLPEKSVCNHLSGINRTPKRIQKA